MSASESLKDTLQQLRLAIVEWGLRRQELSPEERKEVNAEALLQIIPGGWGSALAVQYFGTRERRWRVKTDATIAMLTSELQAVPEKQLEASRKWMATEEFAVLFEQTWLRIRMAGQQKKLTALRKALVSILINEPLLTQSKKEGMLAALDRMSDVDILILQILAHRLKAFDGERAFVSVGDLCAAVSAESASDREFVYSSVDTLANLRFVIHGNIPRTRKGDDEAPIDHMRQIFKSTALGREFLQFIRSETS